MGTLVIEDLAKRIEPLNGYVGKKIKDVISQYSVITGFHFMELDSSMVIVFTHQTLHDVPVSFCSPINDLFNNTYSFV